MSTFTEPRSRPTGLPPIAEPKAADTEARAVRHALALESWVTFATSYAVYAAVGIYTVRHSHLVVGDAVSRLAHAFFVLSNEPRKLTAIGFVWPPVQTLALIPLGSIRTLASSLLALPLTSALFGAALVTLLVRMFRDAGLARAPRIALTATFALNPLILYYATNGMGEIDYLAFLTLAFALYVSWTRSGSWSILPLTGAAMALGVLSRYEVALWLPLLLVGTGLTIRRHRAGAGRLEAAAIVLVVPAVYAIATWAFLNNAITGSSISFISSQFGSSTPGAAGAALPGPLETLLLVTKVHLLIFPLALPLGAAMLVLAARKRDVTAGVLGAALFVNFATTLAFAIREGAPILLQLRYNLRSIPLVFVAIAWLVSRAPAIRRARLAWGFAGLAAVSGAVTAFAMVHPVDSRYVGSYALGERGFLAGLVTGRDQGARPAPDGTGVSLRLDAEMADWIDRHVHGKNAVLTDDAQTFGVMLADGHPERYVDRIDHGEGRWLRIVRRPVGRVQYVLVQSAASPTTNAAFYDRIVAAYPGLGQGNPPPFLRLVHRNSEYALYAVTPRPRR